MNKLGKIIETKIDMFSGGIVNDPRSKVENVCRMATNFDITDPNRLIPYRDMESGDDAGPTSQKQNFCVGYNGTSWLLYALGVKSGATTAEVLSKALTLNGTADLGDNTWAAPTANQSASGATDFKLFLYYKNQAQIYGSRASRYIWAFSPTGTAWADSAYDYGSTFTNITQGLVHSKDDIVYLGIDNKIVKKDGAGAFAVALTLPTHLYVTSICEYGNYLAIAAAPLSGVGYSTVYLWDRDSSLATLSESINFGQGALKVLEEIEGYLIGISLVGGQSTEYAKTDRVVFRYYAGGVATKFKELTVESATTTFLFNVKQKVNNKLYFAMAIIVNGASRGGIWSISKTDGGLVLNNERPVYNDNAYYTLHNFFIVGDYVFTSFTSVSGFAVVKSNNADSYTASSLYETVKYNGGDSDLKKKLIGVTVMFEPLPTAGSVVLKYRKDETQTVGGWVTLFTHTTDNSISHGCINVEATGANLPEYKEIEFQIISTGGAVITGLKFKEEITEKTLY